MKSAGKVIATVFWDAHRITYIGYMGKKQMIMGAYYASFFPWLREEIKKKRPDLIKIVFH